MQNRKMTDQVTGVKNAGLEYDGLLKSQGLKMQDRKMTDQINHWV